MNETGTAQHAQGPVLTPLDYTQTDPEYVPGKYASFPVSPEPMFGPDELGGYKSAIDDLEETVNRADSAARTWEVLGAWEPQLFSRGYQFLTSGKQGFGMYGGVNGSRASGSEIMQTQNAGKLFACNVFSARQDKISSLFTDVPGLTFVPKNEGVPEDETAADEAKKYLQVWLNDAGIKDAVGDIIDAFYTDGTALLWTTSWADEQQWGTETPIQPKTFGAPEVEGVTPETEDQPQAQQSEVPAVRELTLVFDKLSRKVPIGADHERDMAWQRIQREQNSNTLKERYPWIEEKIKGGSSTTESDMARTARINVRLAVQSSSSSGESLQQDTTESFTWYRPSQYRAIKQKEVRDLFRSTFPDGLLVVSAGGEFAFCRNESMQRKLKVIHAKKGKGQNRRAIGSNYLPLQKVLNANLSLVNRYFVACVPRKFHLADPINTEAINGQINDPAKSTPVMLGTNGQKISDITGVENVPQPTTGLMEFVQWLISGAPEAMDGAEPAAWGGEAGEADQGVYQTAKLKRNASRGIYSPVWAQICIGLAQAAEQAVWSAARNRVTNIRSNVPGQGKLEIELGKLQGEALCYPESLEIPQTIADQEAEAFAALADKPAFINLLNAMVSDPRNLTLISKFPAFKGWKIPGLNPVEQQQGEFDLLMQSGPVDNPQLQQAKQLLAQAESAPAAQTPEGQAAIQKLQQQIQNLPPKASSVPVAQDGSENHAIHAVVTMGLIDSAEGRKLKNGTTQPGPNGEPSQQAIYANLMLHWQEHMAMSEKLTPPKEMEFKGTLTVDPSKYSPEVQSKVFQAAGLQVSPEEATGDASLVPHETKVEKEGVDQNGVPTKQVISMVGKGLR